MYRRKLSIEVSPNQPGISAFVKKERNNIKFIKSTTPKAQSSNKETITKSVNKLKTVPTPKKRTRMEISPENTTENHPTKRQNMDQNQHEVAAEPIILKPELQELKKQLFAGFESLIQPLKDDIQDLKTQRTADGIALNVETITRKFHRHDAKQKKLEDRLSQIKDQLLEKNLIFQGLLETEFEDINDIKTQVVKAIATTMPGNDPEEKKTQAGCTSIDQVERLGRYNPQKYRPVKVKFTDKTDVDHVLKNRRKLPEGVYIEREFSRSTEKERRYLRPILKAARKLPKYQGKCRLEGKHVVLDGTHYHRENINTLPPELAGDKCTSKANGEIIAFFGELHPLSNFQSCSFNFEGETFHSSEQLIQWKKARFFNDQIAMERIMNSIDALDSKEIARDITNYNKDEWNRNAEEECYEGIRQKFLQNPHMYNYLLDTGNKTIAEATYDNVWGTGVPLSHKDCLNPTKWTSSGVPKTGILGRILMKIRDSTYETHIENVDQGDAMSAAIESST